MLLVCLLQFQLWAFTISYTQLWKQSLILQDNMQLKSVIPKTEYFFIYLGTTIRKES
jgi:hypothetical protein